ncbi:NPC intracellular cholesterol transporter 2 [Toxorhynchites rutilus septentrionalis]|uniref:NPC intracellular cholesterol transporter 2 n=1 Tax=Toxorhynchites rutilus septentrionalis TaxID=329112 RepID=UPI002478772D|nr:NPC intracellular cholesterol transporter 2 [Toxorhynchites rutilus septentrionalis]
MKCKVGFTILLGLLLTVQTLRFNFTSGGHNRSSPPANRRAPKLGLVFEDCGARFDVTAIWLSSCSSVPCVMPHNANVSVSVAFRTNGALITPTLRHEAYFIILAARIKATISPTTCEASLCPLVTGTDGMMFHASLHISPKLPTLLGKLRWELRNEANEVVLCYQLPVRISVR